MFVSAGSLSPVRVFFYEEGNMQDLMIVIEDVLDEDEYELWRLEYEGYTQEEIAGRYGVSQVAIHYRLKKIQEKLQCHL